MAQVTRSISLPEEVMDAIDEIAERWYTDRSKAIVRIFVEWQEQRSPTVTPKVTKSPRLPEAA